MSTVRQALVFSFLERYLTLAIALGSSMVIARLLTPAEIGVFSVTMAFVGIAQVLRDFGVASYLIQERELTQAHVRTAFGILLVLGGVVFLALYATAPLIALAYAEPAMTATLKVCALNFLALPFCTVSLAMLRREMAFKALALVNFVAVLLGAVISVGLALLGHGVISLAIGAVAVNVVTGLGAWSARADRQVMWPAFTEWRRVFNFGAQSSVAGVVTSVSMDINDLAVGKIMGFEPVAMLSRAQGLMYMFHRDLMSAVKNVAYPAYAKSAREQASLEPIYITSVVYVTAIAWPFYGFVALYAHQILRLMFGPQWDAAASLVPIFCLAGAVAATCSLIASLILAMGHVELVTKAELIFQPFRAALIVAAAMVFKSTAACAAALVIALVIQVPMLYYIKGECLPNDHRSLQHGLWQSLKLAVCTLALPLVLFFVLNVNTQWLVFSVAAMACVVSWVVAAICLKHPLAQDPAFKRFTAWIPLGGRP